MEFVSLMDETQNMWGNIIAIVGFVFSVSLIIAGAIVISREQKLSEILFVSGFVLFIASFSVGVAFGIQSTPENLEVNIKQKYDIASIDLNSHVYDIHPFSSDDQVIKVELMDGTDALFILSQNLETWEPTLDNMPANSGEPGTANISVQEITK